MKVKLAGRNWVSENSEMLDDPARTYGSKSIHSDWGIAPFDKVAYKGTLDGKSFYFSPYDETWESVLKRQKQDPQAISALESGLPDNSELYLYRGNLYVLISTACTEEERVLLVKEFHFKREEKFKKLRKEIRLLEKMESADVHERAPIPEEVRFAVWRRDGGKCVECGGKRNLEFDHIIPVSKGGSNTERNIQLLCEKCNRQKSDKI